MFFLIIDILIYSYTPYLSYFFLLNLNTKSYVYNLSIAILIDQLLMHTFLYNALIITILFLIRRLLIKVNYHNFSIYWLINMALILLYYIIGIIIFGNISWIKLLQVLIINGIFIAICYKKDSLNIKCFR